MSLFKAREWWHARVGQDEEFDVGSLCVASIDSDPTREYNGCHPKQIFSLVQWQQSERQQQS